MADYWFSQKERWKLNSFPFKKNHENYPPLPFCVPAFQFCGQGPALGVYPWWRGSHDEANEIAVYRIISFLQGFAESDKVISEFDQKVTEFIQSKPTAAILKSNYSNVVSISKRAAFAIEKAASAKDEYRVMSAVVFLQELYLYKAYINAAIRLYPEAISLQEQLEGLDAAITKQGSREDYIKSVSVALMATPEYQLC